MCLLFLNWGREYFAACIIVFSSLSQHERAHISIRSWVIDSGWLPDLLVSHPHRLMTRLLTIWLTPDHEKYVYRHNIAFWMIIEAIKRGKPEGHQLEVTIEKDEPRSVERNPVAFPQLSSRRHPCWLLQNLQAHTLHVMFRPDVITYGP